MILFTNPRLTRASVLISLCDNPALWRSRTFSHNLRIRSPHIENLIMYVFPHAHCFWKKYRQSQNRNFSVFLQSRCKKEVAEVKSSLKAIFVLYWIMYSLFSIAAEQWPSIADVVSFLLSTSYGKWGKHVPLQSLKMYTRFWLAFWSLFGSSCFQPTESSQVFVKSGVGLW